MRNDTEDPTADNNDGDQKSSENHQFENADNVGALGEDDVTRSQAAGQSIRWDNLDVCLLKARNGKVPRKFSILALAKGKEKVNRDENSMMGKKNSEESEKLEMMSLIKPNLISEVENVVGFLHVSHGKENKPKTKAKWKKLAREQGLVGDTKMADQGNELRTKHISGIEALDVKENRATKKTHEDFLFSDEQ